MRALVFQASPDVVFIVHQDKIITCKQAHDNARPVFTQRLSRQQRMNTKQLSGMWSAGVKIANYCNGIPLSPPVELLLQVKAVSVRAMPSKQQS